MNRNNPVHAAILKAMKPEFTRRKQSVEGAVQRVNYFDNTVRVYWRDPESGAERESEGVPLPADGDGVFRQAVEEGDRVTMSFRNGNHMNPYITSVHRNPGKNAYQSKFGAGIPKGISFF